jgi:aminoglycoside 6-adenylyltransferase
LTYEHLLESFVDWAQSQPEIRAAVVVGSRARTDRPADVWSDLDLIVLTENADRLINKTNWLEEMGTPWLTFVEKLAVGEGFERRVLFEGGFDVDFVPVPCDLARQALKSGLPPEDTELYRRGFRVVLDKGGWEALLHEALAQADDIPTDPQPPTQAEFLNLCGDFWYHAVWTAKKLRRGELWVAKSCLDSYMKHLLLQMLEWHARTKHGWDLDTWHRGRFLEKWADPRAVEDLGRAFAHYALADVTRALLATMDLFRWVAQETAEHLAYDYPSVGDGNVTAWVRDCLEQLAQSDDAHGADRAVGGDA